MKLFVFLFNSILLGVGLAMDAFSVSMANGLADPHMKRSRHLTIAGTFGFFQFVMPMIGWICVHTIAAAFAGFQKLIPWIALILLAWIGGNMLKEGLSGKIDKEEEEAGKETAKLTWGQLILQGIATSIDALSVGFTIAGYQALNAFLASLIIAIVTFIICVAGVSIGRKFGTKLAGKATVLGGAILIGIGMEIFLSGILG